MKQAFRLEGLCCANCAAKIERAVAKLDGVSSATVSIMTTKMVIEGEDTRFEEIVRDAYRIVKKYEPSVNVKPA
ncbi:MAG: heavy-metal-associated domain-containing protein [Bacillota bacterium]|jgi:copper chaperone CopZ